MTSQNQLQQGLYTRSLGGRALQGAGIALLLAVIFLSVIFYVGDVLVGKNFWQGAWQFSPLITSAIGGTLGGIVYYLMVQVWYPNGWKKVLAIIFSVLIYIVLLWLSLVAGFSATGQWD